MPVPRTQRFTRVFAQLGGQFSHQLSRPCCFTRWAVFRALFFQQLRFTRCANLPKWSCPRGKASTRVKLAIAIYALPYLLVSSGENGPLTKAAQTSQLKARYRHPQ